MSIQDLRLGDNVTGMKELPSQCRDLAIVDPEYGIGESSNNHKSRNTPIKQKNGVILRAKDPIYNKKEWDSKPPSDIYFSELFRVSINQIVFGANYFSQIVGEPFKPPRRAQFEQFLKENPKGWIIWDKRNGENDFNDCELIWASFDFDSFILVYMWAGMMQGKSISEGHVMQGNKKLNEKRIHPTQKPIIIYKYLLSQFATQGDTVMDTHLGSMSIAIACDDLGFDLIGWENDPEIHSLGIKRVNEHKQQLQLFSA